MRYQLPRAMLEDTFGHLRACGSGCRECQALWVSPWADPQRLTAVVHPRHTASAVGFRVEDDWLNAFWMQLADEGAGVRFQSYPSRCRLPLRHRRRLPAYSFIRFSQPGHSPFCPRRDRI